MYKKIADIEKIKQLKRKDGAPVDVQYYDIVDDIETLCIKKLNFAGIKEKNIKNKNIKETVFKKEKNLYIQNFLSKINAKLSIGNIDEMVNDIFKNIKKDNKNIGLKKEIISNVEMLFKKAIPVLKHAELKNEHLFDKQYIHRFAIPVEISNKFFFVMITLRERIDFREHKIEEFSIYNLNSLFKNEKTTDSKSQDKSLSRSQSSIYSITDLVEFVNCCIAKYR